MRTKAIHYQNAFSKFLKGPEILRQVLMHDFIISFSIVPDFDVYLMAYDTLGHFKHFLE